MLNLNHLPTFLAVADCGSVSRGADRLHLSQPAVSGQIAELERCLGQRLFDRLPRRGVVLTAAGEIFRRRAREALALIQDGERAVHDLESLHTGQLAIDASSTSGTYLLPRACGEFRRRHPRVALSLGIANSAGILARVRDGRADLGIVEGGVSDAACSFVPWLRDEILCIAPSDHPLAAEAGPIPLRRLWDHGCVHRENGSGTYQTVTATLHARGLDLPPGPNIGGIEALKRAVAAGVGLGWISSLAVTSELARGELVALPLADGPIHRQHHLVHLRGRSLKPAARAFIEMLQQMVSN